MSVVGIDFGNDSCYISVARQGGIETIANDYSLRATPSYVAFGEKQRQIGVAAKAGQMTNVRRTFFGFKRLLGRKFDDPQVQDELSRFPFEVKRQDDGSLGCATEFLGQPKLLSAEQLTAALFTKLKLIGEAALQTKVHDVVVSVPTYFTDAERHALLDAARVAGLNVLKLMNETTATALAYGIYKQDLPEPDKPSRNVVFVDIGYTGTQMSACSFNKGKLSVLSYSHCLVGGRCFDEAITRHFCEEFRDKYKLDVMANKKAQLKLILEAEKLKKLMSASTHSIPLNIECFMNDIDVRGNMDRAKFEELIASDLALFEKTLKDCLEQSGLKKEDIYSVEIVGGSSRIPSIKTIIEKVYEKVPSTTLNADEAVSRGCALQCAILSPTFKVREFSVTDIQPFPIKLVWETSKKEDVGEMEVFPRNHAVPFSKMLTFYKADAFSVSAEYGSQVPYPEKQIGVFDISEVKPTPEGGNQKIKIKVRINPNGVFTVSSASMIEKVEIEEEVPVEMEVDSQNQGAEASKEEAKMEVGDTTQQQQQQQAPETANQPPAEEAKAGDSKEQPAKEVKMEKRIKTVNKSVDLAVTPRVRGALSHDRLQAASQEEAKMAEQDLTEADRLVAKNSVEEYIYDIRGRLCDELADYMEEEERNTYTLQLEDTENWLYEEGEDADRPAYQLRLSDLKGRGEPVKRRKKEWDERPAAMNQFGQCLQLAQKVIDSYKAGEEKYSHLDAAEVGKVEKAITEKSEWYNRVAAEIAKLAKTADPPVLASQFSQEKEAFWNMASKILNKAKPKVTPPPPKEEAASTSPSSKEPAGDKTEAADQPASPPTVNGGGGAQPNEMDVD